MPGEVYSQLFINGRYVIGGYVEGGSATNLSLSSINDPDTGLFWLGSNRLGLATGDAERARLANAGLLLHAGVAGFPTDPDTALHVWQGTAGAVTALAGTAVTIEDDVAVYLSFLTPNSVSAGVVFGDVDNNNIGSILYNHASTRIEVRIEGSNRLFYSAGVFAFQEATEITTGATQNLTITPGTTGSLIIRDLQNVASVQVMVLEGDRDTPLDSDAAYVTLRMSDSAGNQDEIGRLTWVHTTVLDGATQDGDIFLSVLVNNVLTEFLRLDGSDSQIYTGAIRFLINDTSDANTTVGLTINQGAADDGILAFKSSDVAHGLTSQAETDTYSLFLKTVANEGGLELRSISENAATTNVMRLASFGGQASATKSTAGRSLVEVYISQHDGANALANIAADGNVFGIRARVGGADTTLYILDEDGDSWQSGSVTAGALILSGAVDPILSVTHTQDVGSVQLALFQGDRLNPIAGDEGYISLRLSDSVGTQTEFVRLTWVGTTVTDTAEVGAFDIDLIDAGNGLQAYFRFQRGSLRFDRGAAITAADYAVGRDADGTNQLHLNIPTGATFEFSINDVAQVLGILGGWRFSTGAAVTAAQYEVVRDADGTNQLHFNVPTGATFEWSINDVAQLLGVLGGLRFPTGSAVTAAQYEIVRDADGTNQLHLNVPTGATLEFSINDVPQVLGVLGGWRFSTGSAITAAQYEVLRDADGTNQLHFNVPTGATMEWSINDVAEVTLSATILDVLGNTIDNVGVLISNAATPAAAGAMRLGNAETIAWRNAAAGADLTITFNASDQFAFGQATTVTTSTGNLTLAPASNGNIVLTGAGTGFVDINLATYTTAVGGVDIVRTGNFTGVDTQTAIDLNVAPSLTLTEPAAGAFTWYMVNFDFSGVAVTAGAGTSTLAGLRVVGNTDADIGTTYAFWVDAGTSRFDADLILVSTNQYTLTWTNPAANRTLTIPDPGGAATFMFINQAQTVTAAHTFSATILLTAASPFSMTNGQVVTVVNTAQTVGAANLTVPNLAGVNDTLALLVLAQTFSGVKTFSATTAFTATSPFSIANGQTLTVSTTAQTVGAATLTVPNFAGVSDTFAFVTLAQTFANKTLTSPTITTSPTAAGATWTDLGTATTAAFTAITGNVAFTTTTAQIDIGGTAASGGTQNTLSLYKSGNDSFIVARSLGAVYRDLTIEALNLNLNPNGVANLTYTDGTFAFQKATTITTPAATDLIIRPGTTGVPRFQDIQDAASVQVAVFEGDKPTPIDGDTIYVSFYLSDSGGTQLEAARISAAFNSVTAGSADARLGFWTMLDSATALERFRMEPGIFQWQSGGSGATGTTVATNWWIQRAGDDSGMIFNLGSGTALYLFQTATAQEILRMDTTSIRPSRDMAFQLAATISTTASNNLTVDPGGSLILQGTAGGLVFIGDNANANMTIGLTVNQGASDNQIFALKSSDVATGLTSVGIAATETDDYFTAQKQSATEGGMLFIALAEDGGTSNRSFQVQALGGTPDTTDTSTSYGLVHFTVAEHDGANALANSGATANIFTVAGRTAGAEATRFLIKANGDVHVTNTTLVALDEYDDAALMRAGRAAMAPAGSWLHDNFSYLIEEYAHVLEDHRIMFFERDRQGRITGAMNNLVPSVMLAWDGIWQTRQSLDATREELLGEVGRLRTEVARLQALISGNKRE